MRSSCSVPSANVVLGGLARILSGLVVSLTRDGHAVWILPRAGTPNYYAA